MFLFRFWWLKIEACGEAGDWMELDRHCKSQKSPIGYEVGLLSLLIYKIRNTHRRSTTNIDVLQSSNLLYVLYVNLQPFVEICMKYNNKH